MIAQPKLDQAQNNSTNSNLNRKLKTQQEQENNIEMKIKSNGSFDQKLNVEWHCQNYAINKLSDFFKFNNY